MQVRVKENSEEFGKCGCGRSPTGKCIGWHGLSESMFQSKLASYVAEEKEIKATNKEEAEAQKKKQDDKNDQNKNNSYI